jgi:hypothetical protein
LRHHLHHYRRRHHHGECEEYNEWIYFGSLYSRKKSCSGTACWLILATDNRLVTFMVCWMWCCTTLRSSWPLSAWTQFCTALGTDHTKLWHLILILQPITELGYSHVTPM